MLKYIILCAALSADAFAASISYGADHIRIPPLSAMMISMVCSALLSVSVALGGIIAPVIDARLCSALGFVILLFLGVAKLFDGAIKGRIKRCGSQGKVQFKLFSARCILHVYADPSRADLDRSHILSAKEAALLSLAMSLDGIAIGFGAGLLAAPCAEIFVCSLLITFISVTAGAFLGNRLSRIVNRDFSCLSGLVLIFLAFLKI